MTLPLLEKREGMVMARGWPLELRREKGNHFTLGAEVEVDLPAGLVRVNSAVAESEVLRVLAEKGYPASAANA